MSARLLGLGFACDMGTPGRKLILLKLIDACEDDGSRIYPAVATIARAAQCSTRQVQRELGRFVEIGLLSVVEEGGRGPGSTRRYQLDLDLLRRIEAHGWDAVVKGDTESPLADEAKGDTGDSERVTAATDKGDSWCHPTPPDPSLDPSEERESAGARDGEEGGQDASTEPRDEFGCTDDERKALKRRLWDLAKRYPGSVADPIEKSLPIWLGMDEAKRSRAEKRLEAFAARIDWPRKKSARRPPLHEYLGEEKFDFVEADGPGGGTGGGAGMAMVAAFSREFWVIFARLARAGDMRALGLLADSARHNRPRGVKLEDMPSEAEIAAAWRIDVGSAEWQAWERHFAAAGIAMPRTAVARYAWMPAQWPPDDRQAALDAEIEEVGI